MNAARNKDSGRELAVKFISQWRSGVAGMIFNEDKTKSFRNRLKGLQVISWAVPDPRMLRRMDPNLQFCLGIEHR